MPAAAIPVIAGAAVLGAFAGNERKKIQKKQQRKALQGLTFEELQSFIDNMLPELQDLRSGGVQDLLANMNTTTNRSAVNAQQALKNVFAKAGLLHSGSEAGANASIELARGQDLNLNRTKATDFLLQRVMQALGLGINRGTSMGNLVTRNPVTTSGTLGFLGGMQSGMNMASGAGMFSGGGGGGLNMANLGNPGPAGINQFVVPGANGIGWQ